ncbi:MAG: hypothetical protein M3Q03_01155, partial [Chloroflexota bacterium]|nr:hypothetical protein [Chloroflexota bacterium]
VEGYVFALRRNVIRADVDRMEPLELEPSEPTALYVRPTVGYQIGGHSGQGPGQYDLQDRPQFYATTHFQAIVFEIARQVVTVLVGDATTAHGREGSPALRTRSRQQLFPQVLRLAQEYVDRKVILRDNDPREVGHQRYVHLIVERLVSAIEPDESHGEAPLLPVLNRYKSVGSTADVDFKTIKPCHPTRSSHLNQVPTDSTWEQATVFTLEQAVDSGQVISYARNDGLGLLIPYQYLDASSNYEPDFLVKLADGRTLVLEIKGQERDREPAKSAAARRWASAVTNWGQLGRWEFLVCHNPQMLGHQLSQLMASGRDQVSRIPTPREFGPTERWHEAPTAS